MLAVATTAEVGQTPAFWQTELPLRATDRLLEDTSGGYIFDEIILDEAQDLMRDAYLDFLDLSLTGGLSSGLWRMFGDFERQAIYESADITLGTFLSKRGGSAPVYSLRANCRNTPHVAELVHLLGGLTPRYSKVLRPDNRVEPEILYYSSPGNQQDLLVSALTRLYGNGYSGSEIVVLSPKAEAACAAKAIDVMPWKDRLRRLDVASRGQVGYCTVHAYKGLEAPVVIVTDIDRIDEDSQPLFYIAITRAVDRLVLLLSDNAKRDIRRLLSLPNG